MLDRFLRDRIEEKVGNVVGERAANQKLHREIIDTLGVSALVRLLGMHPALRENIAHGAGEGLKTLARAGIHQFNDIVEDEMAFIECIVRPRDWNRPAVVLPHELRRIIESGGCWVNWNFLRLCFHQRFLSEVEFPVKILCVPPVEHSL